MFSADDGTQPRAVIRRFGKLPHRDWVVLPLLALGTALVMMVCAEIGARYGWPEKGDQCMVQVEHDRPKANCSSLSKMAEGPWLISQYNDCGYRATGSCAPVPAGTVRMVAVGSSTSFGYMVPFDQVWSSETARILSSRCSRPIDVQSMVALKQGRTGFGNLNDVARELPQAIALHPQLIVLVIAPYDLYAMPESGFNPAEQDAPLPLLPPQGLIGHVKAMMSSSRAMTVLLHFMFRDSKRYVGTYLQYGDQAAFMRPPFSKKWQDRIAYVEAAVDDMTKQLKTTGIPLVLAYAPQQAQAYIIADRLDLPGVEAEALDQALATIAKRHDALFADGALAFKGVRNAPDYYYQVDGHLNGAGHSLLGRAVADVLPTSVCS